MQKTAQFTTHKSSTMLEICQKSLFQPTFLNSSAYEIHEFEKVSSSERLLIAVKCSANLQI